MKFGPAPETWVFLTFPLQWEPIPLHLSLDSSLLCLSCSLHSSSSPFRFYHSKCSFSSSRLTPAPVHRIAAMPRLGLISFPDYQFHLLTPFSHRYTQSPPTFEQNKTTLPLLPTQPALSPFFWESLFLRNIKVYLLFPLFHLLFFSATMLLLPTQSAAVNGFKKPLSYWCSTWDHL